MIWTMMHVFSTLEVQHVMVKLKIDSWDSYDVTTSDNIFFCWVFFTSYSVNFCSMADNQVVTNYVVTHNVFSPCGYLLTNYQNLKNKEVN
jgi:hypothetical protein